MSSITLTQAEQARLHNAKPSFIGLVGGELFKITRMLSTWITFILLLCFVAAPNILLYLISAPFTDNFKLGNDPKALGALYDVLQLDFLMVRVFIGFFLIILTANVIGREYQHGTIRILLARGVGRLQLFLAKLSAVVLVALVFGIQKGEQEILGRDHRRDLAAVSGKPGRHKDVDVAAERGPRHPLRGGLG